MRKKVDAYYCEECMEYITNTDENRNLYGNMNAVMCPRHGVVAIEQVHISAIQEATFDKQITVVRTLRHRIVLRYLNMLARHEKRSFRSMPTKGVDAYILTEGKPIGYIAFTPSTRTQLPTIRQMFIVSEERRKGYGTMLFKMFIVKECTPQKQFLVESHITESLKLLEKEGYARFRDDGKFDLIGCRAIYEG